MKTNIFLFFALFFVFEIFVYSQSKAQSAIRQLEEITVQRIYTERYGNYYEPVAPMPDQTYYNEQFTNYMIAAARDENSKGIEYYNKKKWEKAISQFRKASKMNTNNQIYKRNLQNALDAKAYEDNIEKQKKEYEKNDKIFVKSLNNDIKKYNSQLSGLRKTLKSYVPPLEERFPKKIHEGVMLGLFNTQDSNAVKNLKSPFTGKTYKSDEYFATSDNLSCKELLRGVVDNGTLGKYTLNSEHGKQLIKKLEGTHFDRLVAHSNGATVAEALIRENVIEV